MGVDSLSQIATLKDQWNDNADDRKRARRLHDMALGDWADRIPRMPAEPANRAAERPKYAPNFLGQALRALDTLYSEEPDRAIPDSEQTEEWAERALWGFGLGLSTTLARADSLTLLLGTSLLVPAWKAAPDAARSLRAALLGDERTVDASADGVEVLCLARYQFEILANELDPRHAEAVLILMGAHDGKPVHHYWDRENFARLVDFKPQPIGDGAETIVAHGLDDHPCVVCRNDEAELSTYSSGWGGADLEKNLLAIGSLFREYGWTAKLQRGQPYIVGEATQLILAPDAAWELKAGGTAGILANNANLTGQRDALMLHLQAWAQTVGLPARAFSFGADRQAMSGIAIALDQQEITAHRNRRQKTTRLWEGAVTRKAAMLYTAARQTNRLQTVPLDPSSLSIKYQPLPTIVTFEEKRQRLEFLASHGWLAPEDALAELYPDISADEIAARIERAEEYAETRRRKAQEDAEADAARQQALATLQTPQDPFTSLLG